MTVFQIARSGDRRGATLATSRRLEHGQLGADSGCSRDHAAPAQVDPEQSLVPAGRASKKCLVPVVRQTTGGRGAEAASPRTSAHTEPATLTVLIPQQSSF
jgi:hypothetical protein